MTFEIKFKREMLHLLYSIPTIDNTVSSETTFLAPLSSNKTLVLVFIRVMGETSNLMKSNENQVKYRIFDARFNGTVRPG